MLLTSNKTVIPVMMIVFFNFFWAVVSHSENRVFAICHTDDIKYYTLVISTIVWFLLLA